MTILIVEDEPKTRNGLKNLISNLVPDSLVQTACDGKSALALCENSFFDIIFTDIKMPGMDGFELLQSLDRKGMQIVIVSGYADFEYAQKAIKCCVLEYVLKPVNPAKIKSVLQTAVGKVRATRANCLRNFIINYDTISIKNHKYFLRKIGLQKYYSLFRIPINKTKDTFEEEVKSCKNKLYSIAGSNNNGHLIAFSTQDDILGIITTNDKTHLQTIKESIALQIAELYSCSFSPAYNDTKNLHSYYGNFKKLSSSNSDNLSSSEGGNIVRLVKQYINDNYTQNITLNDLAEITYVHPTYLSKLFKKETSQNLTDYILNYRIEKAKQLLHLPNYKIYEVAHATGFNDSKYFGNVFKAVVGKTPSQFRNYDTPKSK